jgi:hypothetical protein
LDADTHADPQTGILSTITDAGANKFINHTGGSPSHHTGDFNSTKVIAGTGRFYVSVGFYDKEPIDQPTGVGVNIAEVHAALVSLGLISA